MAEEEEKKGEETAEAEYSAEGQDGEAGKKKSKKKLIIILAAVLLLGGGAGGFMMMSGDKEKDSAEESHEDGEHGDEHGDDHSGDHNDDHGDAPGDDHKKMDKKEMGLPVYYELPDFIVNLNTGGRRTSFLKMKVVLELDNADLVLQMDAYKPRVLDAFNTYLRELRTSDLAGSAGIYRLRSELMTRLDKSVGPDIVTDILFKEIVVQ